METDAAAWRFRIRELYRACEVADRERVMLRRIDRSAIGTADERAVSLESVFVEAIGDLSRIHGIAPGEFYVYTGSLLLALGVSNPSDQSSWKVSPLIEQLAQGRSDGSVLIRRGDPAADDVFRNFGGCETLLLQPIFTPTLQMLGLIVFADTAEAHGAVVSESEFRESVHIVAEQLTLAYSHKDKERSEEHTKQLWELFLRSDLGPSQCLLSLARMVPDFFPDFGPLALSSVPEVQILVLEESRTSGETSHLTIRATTGSEKSIEMIGIDRSISGLMVERDDTEMPYFCDDPTKPEWRDRYKSYLGDDESRPIRTELAVRLREPSTSVILGVLNIESTEPDAFNLHHIAAVTNLAKRIAPMVEAFEERIQHNAVMHLSVTATTSNYLDGLAGIFRHGLGTPLAALHTDIDLIRKQVLRMIRVAPDDVRSEATEASTKVEAVLDRLLKERQQIAEFVVDFTKDISGFSVFGAFDLHRLVEETVSLVSRSMLEQSEHTITVLVSGETDAIAYCSPLFKQHLFSLLTNAIYSIQLTSRFNADQGLISISIEQDVPVGAAKEVELNTRWRVRVRDNGEGVTAEQLDALRKFVPGTRYRKTIGHGLGLLAVQRFMGAVNGWIYLDSESGAWFEVSLLFDAFRADLHGTLATPSDQ